MKIALRRDLLRNARKRATAARLKARRLLAKQQRAWVAVQSAEATHEAISQEREEAYRYSASLELEVEDLRRELRAARLRGDT